MSHLGRFGSAYRPDQVAKDAPAQYLLIVPLIGEHMMSFSVLSFNLWNINEPLDARYRALESGLERLRPDMVCLQEADRDPKTGQRQAELVAKMCGHKHVVDNDGLAIVCSAPITRWSTVSLPEFPGDFPRQALSAQLLVNDRSLLVMNTHLAYLPEMVDERRVQVEVLLASIQRPYSAEGPMAKVLCGDFNDTADSPAVRAVLDSEENLQDVFAECCPDCDGITYSCHNRYVDPSWTLDQRIDYIFASRDLAISDCSVVFDGNDGFDLASDHFGVFCNLAFR
jgi:endonuclease/exonuclease/phosphatase family metal-dependent hydrolase